MILFLFVTINLLIVFFILFLYQIKISGSISEAFEHFKMLFRDLSTRKIAGQQLFLKAQENYFDNNINEAFILLKSDIEKRNNLHSKIKLAELKFESKEYHSALTIINEVITTLDGEEKHLNRFKQLNKFKALILLEIGEEEEAYKNLNYYLNENPKSKLALNKMLSKRHLSTL